jgi:hypothetical protein
MLNDIFLVLVNSRLILIAIYGRPKGGEKVCRSCARLKGNRPDC